MNFLRGRFMNAMGGPRVELGEGVSLPVSRKLSAREGQQVILGTRPEHLTLGPEGRGFGASVVVVEPTGADTQVFAKVGDAEIAAVFRERHEFRPGESIRLVPDPERTHLFDAESGMSLLQTQ